MATFLKMSEAASLGLHAMRLLAERSGRRVSSKEASGILRVSEAHLAKVFRRLVREGMVTSIRGPKGGFALAKAPSKITLLDIFEAIEGRVTRGTCLLRQRVCGQGGCILEGLAGEINARAREYLSKKRLSDLPRSHPGQPKGG